MYYRRKLILSLIQHLGGSIGKMQLMKLLLIICEHQKTLQLPVYFNFVPYKYGCYSFEANYDLQALNTLNIINEDKNNFYFPVEKNVDSLNISTTDLDIINQVVQEFKDYSNDELMKYTYIKYPYYAINSLSKERLLHNEHLNAVLETRPKNQDKILYTLGYEGISLDTYINR